MPENTQNNQPKPPQGTSQKAADYVEQLTTLINEDKLQAVHTDLSKFDPSNLQDHYRIELKDYMVEISHAKDANTGNDSFVLLFTNLKNIQEGCTEKLILGYLNLNSGQFNRLKDAAITQDLRIKRLTEEKLFKENLEPIDQILQEIKQQDIKITDSLNKPPAEKTPTSEQSPVFSPEVKTPAPNTEVKIKEIDHTTLSTLAAQNPRPAEENQTTPIASPTQPAYS